MFTSHISFTQFTVVVFWFALPAYSQSTKAELLGLIRDPSGLPVQTATIELTNAHNGLTAKVSTGGTSSWPCPLENIVWLYRKVDLRQSSARASYFA